MPAAAAAVAALTCPAGGRGWCAAVAGILEATAAKPGNVHPAASFADLTHADLVAAAVAIAPVLERATTAPLGRTILEAVSAARSAADTNANLGIILLTAPLAAVPDGQPLSAAAVDRVFARLDAADAADVYHAISLARPGGMGGQLPSAQGPTRTVDALFGCLMEGGGRLRLKSFWPPISPPPAAFGWLGSWSLCVCA